MNFISAIITNNIVFNYDIIRKLFEEWIIMKTKIIVLNKEFNNNNNRYKSL